MGVHLSTGNELTCDRAGSSWQADHSQQLPGEATWQTRQGPRIMNIPADQSPSDQPQIVGIKNGSREDLKRVAQYQKRSFSLSSFN
ncbi:MAG: hypothetical protein CMJ81_10845 [Planctomycetaceae bacterium]|nr:hypothetical protein [Planctomycetaceae bacterium]